MLIFDYLSDNLIMEEDDDYAIELSEDNYDLL